MIKEQCAFNSNRESLACDFLSGICLGAAQAQGGSGKGSASTSLAPLDEPSPEESDEPPDRGRTYTATSSDEPNTQFQPHKRCSTITSPTGHWLLSDASLSRCADSKHPFSFNQSDDSRLRNLEDVYEAEIYGLGQEQDAVSMRRRPLAIDVGSVKYVPSGLDQNESCAISEATLVEESARYGSQKSSSESTDGAGSTSSSNAPSGPIKGLFSPIALAKTWGQNHSKVLRSAMKRRTISLDSSNGGMNTSATIILNSMVGEDLPNGSMDTSDLSTQRYLGLTSGNKSRAPFSMFCAINYSRANNKACLGPATRPRGVKVLQVPTSNDRFLSHLLEEVIVLEFEEKEPCVSYYLLVNDVSNSSNQSSSHGAYFSYLLFNSRNKDGSHAVLLGVTNRTEEIESCPFGSRILSLDSQGESYLVPVYAKSRTSRQSTAAAPVCSGDESSRKSSRCGTSSSTLMVDPVIRYQRQVSAVTVQQPICFTSAEFIPDQVRNNSYSYAPSFLDDPSLNYASKTYLKLPGYRSSLLHHEEHPTSKMHVNERFKDRFPYIQLTLTKLRSMKLQLSKFLYVECQFDLCVACYALTYFEKLVFCERVSKANRRYSAACCAILAAKMNDIKGQQLTKLVSNLCSIYKINRSDLLNFEFPVLVALKFNLHLSTSLLRPMYSSLKQTLT